MKCSKNWYNRRGNLGEIGGQKGTDGEVWCLYSKLQWYSSVYFVSRIIIWKLDDTRILSWEMSRNMQNPVRKWKLNVHPRQWLYKVTGGGIYYNCSEWSGRSHYDYKAYACISYYESLVAKENSLRIKGWQNHWLIVFSIYFNLKKNLTSRIKLESLFRCNIVKNISYQDKFMLGIFFVCFVSEISL